MEKASRPVWAEVDVSAIRRNAENLGSLLSPGTKLCAVVKADGYGHGAARVAEAALSGGADWLAVALLDEALELRAAGFTTPVLILGYTPPEQALLVAGADARQTVFTREQAEALSAAGVALGKKVRIHIKIDTGMGRIGVRPEDAADFAARVSPLPGIEVEGAFTHFATADSRDKRYALEQFAAFTRALESIRARGIDIPICHAANSAAILDMPETHLDMVRAGIALYGLWPSRETARPVELRPAMRLKARIAMVKPLPADTSVSYGCTYVTPAPAVIATLPLGYADGWPRGLGNRASVLVGGRRAPVVGRICMDQFMVDVTGIEGVGEGDDVLLFGGSVIPVEEIADLLGTINYEVVCAVSKRVPRVYAGMPDRE
ncbi:MAG: alanine racemase [Planctomycetota bacterium]|jgi:alanine racemase|nr:alanine racemase [Planctomycetota bacterium]